ncbi:MAG: porin family protein [Proteiniphilum sp.]|nr:porin family protein [Proteiniphilum sp.]
MIRKAVYVLLLWLFTSVSGYGQHHRLQHRPYADRQLFHLGFTIGLHTQNLILTQSGYVNENGEVWFSEIPDVSPGFTVGMIGDLYLSRYLNLRFLPTLNLGEKGFLFREQVTGEEYATTLRNNYLTLPLHLQISGGRINNCKPYFLLGGYASLELASKKNQAVRLKPFDTGVEVGK